MAMLSSNLPPRRYERGGVSWVTLLIIVAALGSAWLLVTWVPVYIVHYEVKQTVRDYMNQAIKNRDDAALIQNLCAKLASLDETTVTGEDGSVQRVPTVAVVPDDVTWERDMESQPPMLHVAFEYTRTVRYAFLASTTEWVGQVDISNDLKSADWGPAR